MVNKCPTDFQVTGKSIKIMTCMLKATPEICSWEVKQSLKIESMQKLGAQVNTKVWK